MTDPEQSDFEFFHDVAAELQRLRDHVARRLDAGRMNKAARSGGELLRYTLRQAHKMAEEARTLSGPGDPHA